MTLPVGNRFQNVVSKPADGQNPALNAGVAIPAGGAVNTMGAYTQVIAAGDWGAAGDAYEIEITFKDGNASAIANRILATLGIDTAGGTSYSTLIEYLSACNASPITNGRDGVVYRFPIHIPAGSSLAVKCQNADATLTGCNVYVRLYCDPTKPWLLRTGTGVTTYGAVPATSLGTAVTVGVASEGAWTQIAQLTADAWYWEIGWSNSDTSMSSQCNLLDLGIGDNSAPNRTLVRNLRVTGATTEELGKWPQGEPGDATSGEYIYVRGQGQTETGNSAIVYAVTGRYTPPNTHTVAGTVTINGVAAPDASLVIAVFALDSDLVAELVAVGNIAGGAGAYSISVPENVRSYRVVYDDGTNRGTSEAGTPV